VSYIVEAHAFSLAWNYGTPEQVQVTGRALIAAAREAVPTEELIRGEALRLYETVRNEVEAYDRALLAKGSP
jgi:hypothetical protein